MLGPVRNSAISAGMVGATGTSDARPIGGDAVQTLHETLKILLSPSYTRRIIDSAPVFLFSLTKSGEYPRYDVLITRPVLAGDLAVIRYDGILVDLHRCCSC